MRDRGQINIFTDDGDPLEHPEKGNDLSFLCISHLTSTGLDFRFLFSCCFHFKWHMSVRYLKNHNIHRHNVADYNVTMWPVA